MPATTCAPCNEEYVFFYLAFGYLMAHAPLATQALVSIVVLTSYTLRTYPALFDRASRRPSTLSTPNYSHRRTPAVQEEPSQMVRWRKQLSEDVPNPFKLKPRRNLERFDADASWNRNFAAGGRKSEKAERSPSATSVLEPITEE